MSKPPESPEAPKPAIKGLHAKLADIVRALGYVAKTGKNAHFGYAFAEASVIMAEVRGELAERGIAFHAAVIDATRIPCGSQVLTQVRMKYTLVDSETGEQWDSEWMGEGSDAQDKGMNKSFTASLKYWLINTFLLPLGDDPEADDATDKATYPQQAARPATHSGMAGVAPERADWSGKSSTAPAAPAGNGPLASKKQIGFLFSLTRSRLGATDSPAIKAALRARLGILNVDALTVGKAKEAIDALQLIPPYAGAPVAEPVAVAVPDDEPPPPTDADWDFGRDQ